jgi:uncharacterized protein YbbC (DUF1343 family)
MAANAALLFLLMERSYLTMKFAVNAAGLAIVVICGCAPSLIPVSKASAQVQTGADLWLSTDLGDLAGKRFGLITNHTGMTRSGESTIDVLFRDSRIKLVSLFGVEHGIRGTQGEGDLVSSTVDPKTGLPVHSLYGELFAPTVAMVRQPQIDAFIFDIQDIGTRYYTYVWSMALALEAAAEYNRAFVVLDRPNPIGGELVQGNIRDRRTHVGLYPSTMRHGMTAGEIAKWVNEEYRIGADLRVIKMNGWRRDMWYEDTGLKWIPPSPNMPSLESATHYPGSCLFEGTNLSVGRGTPLAFQQVGAPWLDAGRLVEVMMAKKLPGVRFEAVKFTPSKPTDGKYPATQLNGIRWITTDRKVYDPTAAAVHMLVEIRRLQGDSLRISDGIDRLMGDRTAREKILAGASAADIMSGWEAQRQEFLRQRSKYLLY